MHIGIDVGGTNTDAVLMDGRRVVAWTKATTTSDVHGGVTAALAALLADTGVRADEVLAVAIGTTQFTNAVAECRGLAKTAAIRLGLPGNAGVPPLTGWPEPLVAALGGHAYVCHGGHEYDGREISPLDPDELRRVAGELAALGVTSAAVTSIFSPVSWELEVAAAEILRGEYPELNVSLSHEIGRIGLLERENATIINASLLPVAAQITSAFADALASAGIRAPLYLSLNDGTLREADLVRSYPVATFAAGPTNSMRGAALLSGLDDCIVVDIGGTTTDIGAVAGGFPRPATSEVEVGGVRTNFRMPDVLSLGIGGGSRVRTDPVRVGPDSVGHALVREALVFGGSTLTATDAAVAAGLVRLGDPSLTRGLDRGVVASVIGAMVERIAGAASSLRTSRVSVPLVLVGGGSVLVPRALPGFGTVIQPDDFAVANAIGAAITQVAGEVDRVHSGSINRAAALEDARAEAVDRAVAAGADPASVQITETDVIGISYLPGNAVRLRVKAVGDLVLAGREPVDS